jgi:polyisoprenoid-binding protein YceI
MRRVFIANAIGVFAVLLCSAADESQPCPFEISTGSAVFVSLTNVAGIEVKGKSNALTGHMDIMRDASGVLVRNIDASLPVKSLATGMKVRDEHMRKYIFTTSDGQEPDVRFRAEKTSCPVEYPAREFTCAVGGSLSIRGVARDFRIALNVKDPNGSFAMWRAAGDGVVKLSDYGITRPSQFGVTSADEVKLHLEFTGKQQ